MNTKTEISLKVSVRFSHLDCQGGMRHSASRQLRQWLLYIVFAYSKLSLLYCNKIRVGGIAWFMGGPANCLINLCFG